MICNFVILELCAEAFFCGMIKMGVLAVEGSVGFVVGVDDNLLLSHLLAEGGQVIETTFMDEQTVEGVADTHATGLNVTFGRAS